MWDMGVDIGVSMAICSSELSGIVLVRVQKTCIIYYFGLDFTACIACAQVCTIEKANSILNRVLDDDSGGEAPLGVLSFPLSNFSSAQFRRVSHRI